MYSRNYTGTIYTLCPLKRGLHVIHVHLSRCPLSEATLHIYIYVINANILT